MDRYRADPFGVRLGIEAAEVQSARRCVVENEYLIFVSPRLVVLLPDEGNDSLLLGMTPLIEPPSLCPAG